LRNSRNKGHAKISGFTVAVMVSDSPDVGLDQRGVMEHRRICGTRQPPDIDDQQTALNLT